MLCVCCINCNRKKPSFFSVNFFRHKHNTREHQTVRLSGWLDVFFSVGGGKLKEGGCERASEVEKETRATTKPNQPNKVHNHVCLFCRWHSIFSLYFFFRILRVFFVLRDFKISVFSLNTYDFFLVGSIPIGFHFLYLSFFYSFFRLPQVDWSVVS